MELVSICQKSHFPYLWLKVWVKGVGYVWPHISISKCMLGLMLLQFHKYLLHISEYMLASYPL